METWSSPWWWKYFLIHLSVKFIYWNHRETRDTRFRQEICDYCWLWWIDDLPDLLNCFQITWHNSYSTNTLNYLFKDDNGYHSSSAKRQAWYIFYYTTLGCDIQGFRAMGLSVQYWPRWFQDFPAIWLAVPFGANGAHLGICTLPE